MLVNFEGCKDTKGYGVISEDKNLKCSPVIQVLNDIKEETQPPFLL